MRAYASAEVRWNPLSGGWKAVTGLFLFCLTLACCIKPRKEPIRVDFFPLIGEQIERAYLDYCRHIDFAKADNLTREVCARYAHNLQRDKNVDNHSGGQRAGSERQDRLANSAQDHACGTECCVRSDGNGASTILRESSSESRGHRNHCQKLDCTTRVIDASRSASW